MLRAGNDGTLASLHQSTRLSSIIEGRFKNVNEGKAMKNGVLRRTTNDIKHVKTMSLTFIRVL